MKIPTERIQECWTPISHLFSVTNEEEYDRAVELLSSLIDEIGADERHPLYGFLDCPSATASEYAAFLWMNTGSHRPICRK